MELEKGKDVMEKLSDIRVDFPGDRREQDYLLQDTFPPEYKPARLEGIPEEEKVESSGLDALIVVIRRLIAQMSTEDRDPSDKAIAQQEQKNPLLRLAMSNMEKEYEGHLRAAQYFVLKAFYGDKKIQKEDLTFMALSEHALMYETLWQRDVFLMIDRQQLTRVNDADKWRPHVESDLSMLARRSLIRLGNEDLGDTLSAKFGRFRDPVSGLQVMYQANIESGPQFLRVHYTADKDDPMDYANLHRVVMDASRLGSVDGTMTGARKLLRYYTLIAQVRLSEDGEEKDVVRTYTSDARALRAPLRFSAADVEPLGLPGTSYILYYAICPRFGRFEDHYPPELPWRSTRKDIVSIKETIDVLENEESPPESSSAKRAQGPAPTRVDRRGPETARPGQPRGRDGRDDWIGNRSDYRRGNRDSRHDDRRDIRRDDRDRNRDRDRDRFAGRGQPLRPHSHSDSWQSRTDDAIRHRGRDRLNEPPSYPQSSYQASEYATFRPPSDASRAQSQDRGQSAGQPMQESTIMGRTVIGGAPVTPYGSGHHLARPDPYDLGPPSPLRPQPSNPNLTIPHGNRQVANRSGRGKYKGKDMDYGKGNGDGR
ncbi:hypothetical protein ABKA04_003398 [Annulohypoxylon sp. FPYF3050]